MTLGVLTPWMMAAWALVIGPAIFRQFVDHHLPPNPYRTWISSWGQALILCALYAAFDGKWQLLGLALPGWRDLWLVPLGLAVSATLYSLAMRFLVTPGDQVSTTATAFGGRGYGVLLFTAITAGVTEEWIFRGFAFSQLTAATGSVWAAAVLSGAAFTWAHKTGYGWKWLIPVAIGAVMLTLMYVHTGNLWLPILTHTLIDLGALLSVKLNRATPASAAEG